MTVNEETRHEVFEAFKVSHGANIAGALLEMLPPAGIPELATKADVAVVKADVDAFRVEVRAELSAMEARIGERVESALKDVQKELRDQATRFIGWVFAAAGLSLGAASAIARLG